MAATKRTLSRKEIIAFRFAIMASCGFLPALALLNATTPGAVRLIAAAALIVPPTVWLAMDWAKARGGWISKR